MHKNMDNPCIQKKFLSNSKGVYLYEKLHGLNEKSHACAHYNKCDNFLLMSFY